MKNRLPEKARRHVFRIRVQDTNTGKARVNLRLCQCGQFRNKNGRAICPGVEGLNGSELMQFIHEGTIRKVVDVYDDEDGEHVEVFLE